VIATIGEHTHVFSNAAIRTDVAPRELVDRFGPYWWFGACEICAEVRVCPATGDLLNIAPEVPLDWQRWRQSPEQYESPLFRALSALHGGSEPPRPVK
jgi:hypothetical protein